MQFMRNPRNLLPNLSYAGPRNSPNLESLWKYRFSLNEKSFYYIKSSTKLELYITHEWHNDFDHLNKIRYLWTANSDTESNHRLLLVSRYKNKKRFLATMQLEDPFPNKNGKSYDISLNRGEQVIPLELGANTFSLDLSPGFNWLSFSPGRKGVITRNEPRKLGIGITNFSVHSQKNEYDLEQLLCGSANHLLSVFLSGFREIDVFHMGRYPIHILPFLNFSKIDSVWKDHKFQAIISARFICMKLHK